MHMQKASAVAPADRAAEGCSSYELPVQEQEQEGDKGGGMDQQQDKAKEAGGDDDHTGKKSALDRGGESSLEDIG